MKNYRAVKELEVEYNDGDGGLTGRYGTVRAGSALEMNEDSSRIAGGEVSLYAREVGDFEWIEISKETFAEYFEEVVNEAR